MFTATIMLYAPPIIKCYMFHLKLTEKGRHTNKTSANKLDNTGTRCEKLRLSTFTRVFESPANQSDHEKNQKNQDVICKWVSGQDVLNLLADWSQKKREKKNIYRDVGE